MAYDKVIDSAVLDANLKAVADAIREKGGTSDNLVFPTGFAEAIAAIETAGGDVKVTYGTYTPAEILDVTYPNYIPIEHGLGMKPTLVAVRINHNYPNTNDNRLISLMLLRPTDSQSYWRTSIAYGYSSALHGYYGDIYFPNETTFHLGILGTTTKCTLHTVGYQWLAIGGVNL